MKDHDDFGCTEHSDIVPHYKHKEGGKANNKIMHDHERGVGHPAHHTKGKHPSQLNPDHGPHDMRMK